MKLNFADVAEIQESLPDELKKVKKQEFSAGFQKMYHCAKAYVYENGVILNKKRVCVFLMCLRFLKKSVLKLLDRTVYLKFLKAFCFVSNSAPNFGFFNSFRQKEIVNFKVACMLSLFVV